MDHARTPTSEQYLVPRALFDECLLHFATLKRLLLETDVEAVDQDLEAFSKLDLSLQYMQQVITRLGLSFERGVTLQLTLPVTA